MAIVAKYAIAVHSLLVLALASGVAFVQAHNPDQFAGMDAVDFFAVFPVRANTLSART